MAFLSDKSCECTHGQLDIFAIPPTQTSIPSSRWSEYRQFRALIRLNFSLRAAVDLTSVLLYVRAKLVQPTGANLQAASTAAPVNLLLHSMFSQVDVSLNNVLISSSTSTYAYRSYLKTLLSYGEDATKSQYTSELFFKDEAGHMDSVIRVAAGDNAPNAGLQARRLFTAESREVDLIGRLHCDIFLQPKHLINEVAVKLKLIRSSHEFVTMGAASNLVITHAAIYARKLKLTPSVFLAHAKTLETSSAQYNLKRVQCKSIAIARGLRDSQLEKIFSGQIPTRVIVGLVSNIAFNGSRKHNPYFFHHYNLTEASLFIDGQLENTTKPIEMNFGDGRYIRAYSSLFSGTGKLFADEGLDINRTKYANGYTLIAWDLTPDGAENDHLNLIKNGSVRLSLKFGEALPHTVSCIIYAEFDSLLSIDKHRQVVADFTV